MHLSQSVLGTVLSVAAFAAGATAENSSPEQSRNRDDGIAVQAVIYDNGLGSALSGDQLDAAIARNQIVFLGTFRKVFPASPPKDISRRPELRWVAIIDVSDVLKGTSNKLKTIGVYVHSPARAWFEGAEKLAGQQCVYGLQMTGGKVSSGELLYRPVDCNRNNLKDLRERLAKGK